MNRVIADSKAVATGRLAFSLLLLLALGPCANKAAASVIYSDNFTGGTLNSGWHVLSGQGTYSMVGDLRYYNDGPSSGPAGWGTTSLSLAYSFAGSYWEVDVEATYHLDWLSSGTFTGPPVPAYVNSSGTQGPQVMVSFSSVTESDRSALGYGHSADFERVIDAWYGNNELTAGYETTESQNLVNPAGTWINNNIADGTYWYQFIRTGGTLAMNYSYDGVDYATAFSAPLANPSGSFNELVLSGTTFSTAGSYTDYSLVTIKSLDAVPEPSGFVPLALCLAGAGVKRFRRKAVSIVAAPVER